MAYHSADDANATQAVDASKTAATIMEGFKVAYGRPTQATSDDLPLTEAEDNVFPCMLVICGSGLIFLTVLSILYCFMKLLIFSGKYLIVVTIYSFCIFK